MTELEKQTLADGFRVCLLGADVDRKRNLARYGVCLFDGGRRVDGVRHEAAWFSPAPSFFSDLRSRLVKVLAPPHVTAVHGSGWQDLLTQTLPGNLCAELRTLDLLGAARALQPGLAPGAGLQAIIEAWGLGHTVLSESITAPVYEDVLWSVLRAAGRAGLTWPALLTLSRQPPPPVSFERYAFDAATIAGLPAAPGVYLMRDREGQTLYVGKAADLNRRLKDYFSAVQNVPEKLQKLRDRIHDFDAVPVGSELEALLVEHKLIRDLKPALNVQRRVAEGRSRYAAPLTAAIIACPSVKKNCVELFFFGRRRGAVQCRVDPRRLPRKRLAMLSAHYTQEQAPLHRRGLTDWGGEGNEICCRYFARFKNRLNWLEVPPCPEQGRLPPSLTAVFTAVAERPTDAAEFRLGTGV